MQDKSMLQIPLPAELKRTIKATAAQRGESMMTFVETALREWIRAGKPRLTLHHVGHDLESK
jgi:hypothetical protein